MAKKIIPSVDVDICQIAIFDDKHTEVQSQINQLFRELQISGKEILSEKYEHYIGENEKGETIKCTYAIIRYQLKNPAK